MNDILGLLALFGLVLMNGFFVAAEFALVSVRRTRIDQLADEGNATAKATQRALHNLDLYIAATQLGITMASLAIGFVAEPAIEHLVSPLFANTTLTEGQVRAIAFGIAFAISTVLHIVFGELAPKSWALQRNEQVSLLVTRPLLLFTLVFKWAIVGLNAMGNGVVRLFGLRGVAGHAAYSEEEIRMIVSASSQEGVLEDSEKELVYNVFDLSDTTVREIMTPRVDMIVVDGASPLRRMLELNAEHGYSRVPVYQDTADNIVGIVHSGDVLRHINELDSISVSDVMRKVFFVPEGMKIKDLLTKMREKKSHLSVVVDEFGGTAGLVTLEDALEEIVGEIYDETDEEELPLFEIVGEGVYLIDGGMIVHEVEQILGSNLEDGEGEFDTLGGFMTDHYGDIPEVGYTFVKEGWAFTVEEADERRVSRIRVERADDPGVLALPEEASNE
jgi:CBS domain containing-hemolysin-like protein